MEACALCAEPKASITNTSSSTRSASSLANASPFFVSSAPRKRVFSRTTISPSFISATAFFAFSPTTVSSLAKTTFVLTSSASLSAAALRENLSSGPFFGLPRCEQRTIFAPFSTNLLIVGSAAWILLSFVILPSFIGTLKSTRTRTFLPFTCKSSTFFLFNLLMVMILSLLLYLYEAVLKKYKFHA